MSIPKDSLTTVRLDTQLLESLKKQGDYVYRDPVDDRSLWDVIQEWLWGWLERNGIQLEEWMLNLLTALGIGVIFYVIYLFLRNRTKIRRKKKIEFEKPDLQHDQKKWDQNYLIQNYQTALNEQDWALAIHWTYHMALVELNKAQKIKRSMFKISSDYLKEIESPQLSLIFQELRLLHQVAWYDERECTSEDLSKSRLLFDSLIKEVEHGQ